MREAVTENACRGFALKILFYNHTGTVSGAERVMAMILSPLDRARFAPVVVCPDASPMMEMTQKLNVRTLGLQPLEARFTWRLDLVVRYLISFASVIRSARRLVIKEAPDIIHANSIRAGLVMAAATLGLDMPVIWHAHDILPHHPLSTAVRLFAAVSDRNRILAVSQAVADRFRGIILRPLKRRVPVVVIHNAVDLERFKPDTDDRAEIRSALGLGEAQPVVGIVGQLTPRKGQLELIEAFASISSEIKDAVLLIAGAALFNRDEEYAAQLQSTAESLGIAGRVRFLGSRDDIPQLMQGLDVLVVNSHEEPFALTVLEGLSSGTAVLATSVGGTPEMVRHGFNGWLVKARNHDGLVKGMMTLLRDQSLRDQLGREGRREAIARFSIKRFLGEVEQLYSRLLERGDLPQHGPTRNGMRSVPGAVATGSGRSHLDHPVGRDPVATEAVSEARP
jgi:glycosyltransferase involved in cell wall biosynthesis